MLESLPRRFGIMDRATLNRRAEELLAEVGLAVDPRMPVSELGVAQMQLVEIAKALGYDSKLLVLDEPTATLTPPEIERLFAIIKRLKAKGVTIIYISHRLHEVFEIGDRVTVLRNGRLVETRDLQGLSVPDLVRMMIGRDIADEYGFNADIAWFRRSGSEEREAQQRRSAGFVFGASWGNSGCCRSGRVGPY